MCGMVVPCSMSNKTACLGKDADCVNISPTYQYRADFIDDDYKAMVKIKENRGYIPVCSEINK